MDRLGGGQVWGRNAPGRDLGTVRHKAQTAPRGFHFCAVFAFSHAVLRAGGAGDADASARAPEMRRTKTCALPSLRKPIYSDASAWRSGAAQRPAYRMLALGSASNTASFTSWARAACE